MPRFPNFSNPRLVAVINDYPLGGNKRGVCTFRVEDGGKKGFRVSRVTTGKPKYSTSAGKACIVDGDDGKTYILHDIPIYKGIKVMRHDFMDATSPSTVYQDGHLPDDAALYATFSVLIANAK